MFKILIKDFCLVTSFFPKQMLEAVGYFIIHLYNSKNKLQLKECFVNYFNMRFFITYFRKQQNKKPLLIIEFTMHMS